ncbi:MAG TPA: SMP-30/gluconolactonase/LRE family protein [Methylomirabilota bacterium]|nr:SMP-30/gluconolactonase/LRE family protein [Methylomirabilota bacterium]
MRAELVLDCRNAHGEGVLWSAEHALLMWTDIHGRRLWTYNPATGDADDHPVPGRLCCFAPRRGRPWNELVAAFSDGFALLDVRTGARRDIAAFEPDLETTRLNDGRTDPVGRLIAGGMDDGPDMQPISSVWRLDPDLRATRLFGGVACANSTCFSPDGRTMYFADSPTREIRAFPYDPETGEVGDTRPFAAVDGIPDGSCVDAEGFVWNAVWEGYRVDRWSPDGTLDRSIEVPVAKATCCAFGGPDLDVLYITTSRLGEPADRLREETTAGGLYQARPGITGLPTVPFAG